MQSVIEYLKMHMEMREDSNVCTVPVKHEPYASNKNRSGCTRNNFLKFMLTNKHLTYPPRNTCGLFESLVTPNTSGIKSPLKLKMQNNFSSAWAIPGAAISCSLVNLYLVIWQFPTQLLRMFSCVTYSGLRSCWRQQLLLAFYTMPFLWFSSSISPAFCWAFHTEGVALWKGYLLTLISQ